MPYLSLFTVQISLDEYSDPYLSYMWNEYQHLMCWITWMMRRFGFAFQAIEWSCGYRQVTEVLPANAFLSRRCSLLYRLETKLFKLEFRRMQTNVQVTFSELSDPEPSTFIMPNASITRNGIIGEMNYKYLPGLHTYLQRIVDETFKIPGPSCWEIIDLPDPR